MEFEFQKYEVLINNIKFSYYFKGKFLSRNFENCLLLGFKNNIMVLQDNKLEDILKDAMDSQQSEGTELKGIQQQILVTQQGSNQLGEGSKKFIILDGKKFKVAAAIRLKSTTGESTSKTKVQNSSSVVSTALNKDSKTTGTDTRATNLRNDISTETSSKSNEKNCEDKNNSKCCKHCKKMTRTVSTETDIELLTTKNSSDKFTDTSDLIYYSNTKIENDLPDGLNNDFLGYIIGENANLGIGFSVPTVIKSFNNSSKKNELRLQFFEDLKNCLTAESGRLPIHKAVLKGDMDMIKRQCVVLTARREGVNIVDINNYTPLLLAVSQNVNIEVVQILLSYNADLTSADNDGNTVLHLAVGNNRKDLLELFLSHGGESFNVDVFNHDGLTPLMMCCCDIEDKEALAVLLVNHGAVVNLRDKKSGRTALFHAAENFKSNIVKLLLNHEADTKIRTYLGPSTHEAMFELEDVPTDIKCLILGRSVNLDAKRKQEQAKTRNRKRRNALNAVDPTPPEPHRKVRIYTTPSYQNAPPRMRAKIVKIEKSK